MDILAKIPAMPDDALENLRANAARLARAEAAAASGSVGVVRVCSNLPAMPASLIRRTGPRSRPSLTGIVS